MLEENTQLTKQVHDLSVRIHHLVGADRGSGDSG